MSIKKKITFKFPDELFVPALLPFLWATSFIQLFTGNRGSGKTKFLVQKAVIYCLTKKYFRLLYVRKVSRNIRDTTFLTFKSVIKEWNLEKYFLIKESEMDIICTLNGNMMLSYGLDEPEKLKGVDDITTVLADEMTEITFQDFASLIGVLRTQKAKTEFWGSFNPEYGFWGKEYFFADPESDEIPLGIVPAKSDDTLIFKASFKFNPFIDSIAYEKQLLELAAGDENKLTVWIDGNWGQPQMGNEYYTKYKKSVHVGNVSFIPYKPVHLSFDFNTVPYMTALASQVDIGDDTLVIRIFKEYCLKSPFNTTEDVCKAFIEDYGDSVNDVVYYGDASGNNNIAGKGNVTAFDDVRLVLFKYLSDGSNRVLRKNPSVLKRRDFLNNLFEFKIEFNGMKVSIIIDASCKELIKDLLKLKLGIDGKLKKKIKDKESGITYEELGHTSDALEYFVIKLLWEVFKLKI